MELQLLEKDKDTIKIQVKDADMTLISPLISELLTNKDVAEVKYVTGHPELDIPTLMVRVTSGKPQNAVKTAAKSISNQYKDLRTKLEKSK